MSNVLKHRFVSAKTDGADPTQIQPSNWNDGHVFTGGNAGEYLVRDPLDAAFGAKWQPFPALGVWQSYAPEIVTNGNPFVLGNGTLTGRYALIGKVVHLFISLAIGSTTDQGSGAWFISFPPAAPQAHGSIIGTAMAQKQSGSGTVFVCAVRASSATHFFFQVNGLTGGGVVALGVPFAWASPDTLDAGITYGIA